MTDEYLQAERITLEFGYDEIKTPWFPPKVYTMADGTTKVGASLIPGDIYLEGGRRWEVEDTFEDGTFESRSADPKPEPCQSCGHRELTADEILF